MRPIVTNSTVIRQLTQAGTLKLSLYSDLGET